MFQFKKASVAVILFKRQNSHHILLTKRSSNIRTHKGQVSFPGGRQDLVDSETNPQNAELECALRAELRRASSRRSVRRDLDAFFRRKIIFDYF